MQDAWFKQISRDHNAAMRPPIEKTNTSMLAQQVMDITDTDYKQLLDDLGFAALSDFALYTADQLQLKGFKFVHCTKLLNAAVSLAS